MSGLTPIPFPLLLARAMEEYARSRSIFDLPERSFHVGDPALDLSVEFQGRHAGTPLGPASGPHGQLAQNVVLSWLAGSRIIELKTVQLADRLEIPRPCIHVPNVGYNVEWSQELRIEESLREYVAGSMLIEILQAAGILEGERPPVQLDLSLGYDLAGITSEPIRRFIERMKDARPVVDELRRQIPDRYAQYRDLPFRTDLCSNVPLSTFHGCPPGEIEAIVRSLLVEMDLDVCVKLNPTMLGRERVEQLVRDRLGYADIEPNASAFDRDVPFEQAEDMVRGLLGVARSRGRRLSVKMCNTLEVINLEGKLPGRVAYLSGQPLHVIALHMIERWRGALGAEVPISFSAGADALNFPTLVAIGLVPVTTCTDLLRPGGYGRLPGYLVKLEERMRSLHVRNIPDFIVASGRHGKEAITLAVSELREEARSARGEWPEGALPAVLRTADETEAELVGALAARPVDLDLALADAVAHATEALARWDSDAVRTWLRALAAVRMRARDLSALLHTPDVVRAATEDPRYGRERNKATPRRTERELELFDCLSCDKCVSVCPNDSIFSYPTTPVLASFVTLTVADGRTVRGGEREFVVERRNQYACYADACNECGNCDTHCPEHGGPHAANPRVFSTRESWEQWRPRNGFHVARGEGAWEMLGRIDGREYRLEVPRGDGPARFGDGVVTCEVEGMDGKPVSVEVAEGAPEGHTLDLEAYCAMRCLLNGLTDPAAVHFVNAEWLGDSSAFASGSGR